MNFFKTCFEPETHQEFMPQQKYKDPHSTLLPSNSHSHSRSHFNFPGNPRSLPNKLKSRQNGHTSDHARAFERDSYGSFLLKKQSQMELWGETFRPQK